MSVPCAVQQLLRPQLSTYAVAMAYTGVPVASNYAPGIKPQAEVAELGYAQNLWLFGPKHEITEVGTMNFFCLWRNNNGGTVSRACRRPTCSVLGSLTARCAALGTPLARWDRARDGARYATARRYHPARRDPPVDSGAGAPVERVQGVGAYAHHGGARPGCEGEAGTSWRLA